VLGVGAVHDLVADEPIEATPGGVVGVVLLGFRRVVGGDAQSALGLGHRLLRGGHVLLQRRHGVAMQLGRGGDRRVERDLEPVEGIERRPPAPQKDAADRRHGGNRRGDAERDSIELREDAALRHGGQPRAQQLHADGDQ
jgi:hypothetical protein